MLVDRLWAPWRMEFIRNAVGKPSTAGTLGGCFLCAAAGAPDAAESLVAHRGAHCFVMLNRYPYNNGHLMVSPIRHEARLDALTGAELAELMALTVETKKLLDRLVHPHGFNVGMNLGRAAGAGMEDHLHMHIVPRWSGDTNFITTIGSTKVIPEALEELWQTLRAEWGKPIAARPAGEEKTC